MLSSSPAPAAPLPRAYAFLALSLDGFLARKDGSLDWLDAANQRVPRGEDCGFAAFLESVDALVLGRNTWDSVVGFEGWPYADTPVHVLSSRPAQLPPRLASLGARVHFHRGAPVEPRQLLLELAAQGAQRVYVDGGHTVRSFLAAGLLEELTLTTIPTLLGDGLPLFGGTHAALELLESKSWDFGFVQQRWRVLPLGSSSSGG